MRSAVVAVTLAGAVFAAGCSGDVDSEPPVKSIPGLDTPSSTSPPTTGGQPRARVELTLEVTASRQTRAFAAYVQARTESFQKSGPTRSLRVTTTGREYERQRNLLQDALESGFTVPAEPRVAVVSQRDLAARTTLLDVCFHLPSTEYIDMVTGDSPYGDVPDRWQRAVVTMARQAVTWKVDKVMQPNVDIASSCRGLR